MRQPKTLIFDTPACKRVKVYAIIKDDVLCGKIVAAYPNDGAGRVRVDLFDWSNREGGWEVQSRYAGGYGYCKFDDCMQYFTFAGQELPYGRWQSTIEGLGYKVVNLL
jgi:hypothetical protein